MSFRTQEISRLQLRLRQAILEISFLHHYPHIGSCLGMIDIIESIYQVKKPTDVFVLSNGHAAIAYYAVLEKHHLLKRSETDELMVHPDCCPEKGIMVSSGSLGQGLPIAIGWALADPKRMIYCSISDGECMEGSIWESLRIISEQKIQNICVILNANGWGAYRKVNLSQLKKQIRSFGFILTEVNGHNLSELKVALKSHKKIVKIATPHCIVAKTTVEQLPFLKGQAAHYHVMSDENYELAKEIMK